MAEDTKKQLEYWLDDLTVRFLLNLPKSELSSVPRLCFQVEEAQWFYEDFIRPAANAAGTPLPSLPLKNFMLLLFQHCPLLSGYTDEQHIAAYDEFLAYKVRVPVRGAILMNENMDKVILVKGWKKGASWSFPRGKINKNEKDLDCAIREVHEETGYDIRRAGLVPADDEDRMKYIDIVMREQHIRLFVFRRIPEDTRFEPKTRKEISKIAWYHLRDLPGFKKQKQGVQNEIAAGQANKFYMVAPFLGPLKKWINQQRKSDAATRSFAQPLGGESLVPPPVTEDEADIEDYHEATPEQRALAGDSTEGLRRLMGVGVSEPAPQPHADSSQPNRLSSLLQDGPLAGSSSSVPRASPLQAKVFPQQPEKSKPQHSKNTPSAYTQDVPHFLFNSQRLQQQQIHYQSQEPNYPTSTTDDSGSGRMLSSERPQQSLAATATNYLLPTQAFAVSPFVEPTHISKSAPPQNSAPLDPRTHVWHVQHRGPPQLQPLWQLGLNDALAPQGPQDAIGHAPTAPNAEQLPMPKLNAHSMKLLDAFKSISKPMTSPVFDRPQGRPPRQPSAHQAALLDLLSKPSDVKSAPKPLATALPPNDTSQKPSATELQRRHTLNEITRTLPKKKIQTPMADEPKTQLKEAEPPQQIKTPIERPHPRQIHDPSSQNRLTNPRRTGDRKQPQPPVSILQRPQSSLTSRLPRSQNQVNKIRHVSASPEKQTASGSENGKPAPSIRILARPGSRRESKSPQAVPSLFESEVPQPVVRPKIFKRPPAENVFSSSIEKSTSEAEKRDRLIALFGSAPTLPTLAPKAEPVAADKVSDDHKGTPFNIFTDTLGSSVPTPPAAPRIALERHSTAQGMKKQEQQQLNLPLELPTRRAASTQNSPGTSISPFVLGTPAHRHVAPPAVEKKPAMFATQERASRSLLSSVASPSSETPADDKQFLMRYLEGIVRREKGGA